MALEVLPDPYPTYRWLRDNQPVYWDDHLDSWILTRYPDCRRVLADHERFVSDWRKIGVPTPAVMHTLQSLDPPPFSQLHALMTGAFRSIDYSQLARNIQAHAARLLSGLLQRDGFDFVTDFSNPIALVGICSFLGVEAPDSAFMEELSNTVVASMDSGLVPEAYEPGFGARQELSNLALRWLRDSRGDGVVGYLSKLDPSSELAPPLVANSVRALLLGGYASWGSFLALAVLHLLRHRDAAEHVRSHGIDDRAVNELIRFGGPVQAESRAAIKTVSIRGRRIRRGDIVVAVHASANRDPAAFNEPDQLILTRHPNPHLGFGHGIHGCLGVPFVLRMTRVVLGVVAGQLGTLRLDAEPAWKPRATIRGLASLAIAVVS